MTKKRPRDETQGQTDPQRADILSLDVGGVIYKTTVSTLCQSSHYFNALLAGKFREGAPDAAVFIDRDGDAFGHILRYLRSGFLNIPRDDCALRSVITEADFYGLDSLLAEVKVRTIRNLHQMGGFAINEAVEGISRLRGRRAAEQKDSIDDDRRIALFDRSFPSWGAFFDSHHFPQCFHERISPERIRIKSTAACEPGTRIRFTDESIFKCACTAVIQRPGGDESIEHMVFIEEDLVHDHPFAQCTHFGKLVVASDLANCLSVEVGDSYQVEVGRVQVFTEHNMTAVYAHLADADVENDNSAEDETESREQPLLLIVETTDNQLASIKGYCYADEERAELQDCSTFGNFKYFEHQNQVAGALREVSSAVEDNLWLAGN